VKKARFFILKGLDKMEVECDGVILETSDGQAFELYYRKSDNEISLTTDHGRLIIVPCASNTVRVRNEYTRNKPVTEQREGKNKVEN